MFENRKYLIIPITELFKVNFNEVLTPLESLRYSNNGQKTFIKWDNIDPNFISNITNSEGTFTHDEILNILNNNEWSININNNINIIEI